MWFSGSYRNYFCMTFLFFTEEFYENNFFYFGFSVVCVLRRY
jgi:hypothetical protein